jgi:hypothetical protein
MVLLFVFAIALGALLSGVSQEHRTTDRTVTWKTALPIAEAGIEEAMAHLNSGSPRETNGWAKNSTTGHLEKRRTFPDGYFETVISDTEPPVIRARGFVAAQPHTNYLSRTIEVTTRQWALAGIEVKDYVKCGSDGVVDSYDSADPNHSTPTGQYDPAKAKDNVLVATISATPNKIDVGSRKIYGYVATGGGSVQLGSNGKVGSKSWIQQPGTGGTIEAGHYDPFFKTDFPPVVLPFRQGEGLAFIPSGYIGTNYYKYIFGNGDYEVQQLRVGPSEKAIVIGKARILVISQFVAQGIFVVGAGASVEFYCQSPAVNITGHGFVNENGRARYLKLFGAPGNTDIRLQGSADFLGIVYAPDTKVSMAGSSVYYGKVKSKSVDLSGGNAFHGDENTGEPRYLIASWKEIP